MYLDGPFGYKIFPNDDQMTVNWLCTQSKQFDAINTKGNHVWIIVHKADDMVIVKEALEDRGYNNIQQIYWVKENHYVEGPVHRLTPTVEVVSFGCIPNAAAIHWNVDKDPRKRPNVFYHPSLLTLTRDTSGNIINKTEKPPAFAQFLLSMFCKPGGTVLIIGTGAGGCVKGALQAGLNVIGVENDEKQYNQLFSELNSWVAGHQKVKDELKAKSEKVKKPSEPPIGKAEKKGEADVPTKPGMVIAATEEGKCFSCDEPGKEDNPLEECTGCGKMNHEKECMEEIADEEGNHAGIYCGGCKERVFGEDSGRLKSI